jgi:peptide/nickel transport system substrate-binding protein
VLFAADRSYVGIDFNTAVEPFDDIHVRRPSRCRCDREAFVDKLLAGHGEVASALTTPEQIEAVVGADVARDKLKSVIGDIRTTSTRRRPSWRRARCPTASA